jgi:hypothetical protein
MWFFADLLLLLVGIAVAGFLIKLFVSLRVASKAPVWQELGDKEPGDTNSIQAAAGIRTEQISLDADAPDQKCVGQSFPEYLGQDTHVASGTVR